MEEILSRIRLTDYILIGIYSFVLFGFAGVSGRPLTMHEARLPETAREMKLTGHWLLPRSGIRPWLERPPLPHWVVIGAMKIFGHDDRVWVVRFPSAIMGLITVLLTTGIASRAFGRNIGILSGLVLAASYEFTRYSGLAEDDIYLGALVAVCLAIFANLELSANKNEDAAGFFNNRPWKHWAFFIVLGLTNLAKGPLLGLAVVGVTVGPFLLWNTIAEGRWNSLRRYFWCWGWLILAVLTLAWPLIAYHKFPDVVANWKYDYLGRMNGAYSDINQKWFYYGPALALAMVPWTPACLIGLLATAGATFRSERPATESEPVSVSPRQRSLRFVWCWAIFPSILFSIPKGKHDHYLIPFLAPWAIMGAFGAVELGKWILAKREPKAWLDPLAGMCVLGFPGAIALAWFHLIVPGPQRVTLLLLAVWLAVVACFFVSIKRGSAALLTTSILAAWLVAACWTESFLAARTDHTVDDTAFLERARKEVPTNARLFIDAQTEPVGNLDFFRLQFYSPTSATLLHNLSYLQDEDIHDAQVFVIARAKDEDKLAKLGTVSIVDQSPDSHEPPKIWTIAQGRFTLFKLTFDPNLKRYPAPTRITNLQAMQRDRTGPWCGTSL